MGKLDIDLIIHHFSHQHPLKLLNFQPQTRNTLTCSGCKLEASGWIYNCSTCNYCLHESCSRMPRIMSHPVDPNHSLILLSSPVYPEGAFKCNACEGLGTGFCYHCKECQLDIHILCAFMPSSVNHCTHHHTLNLCFSPPYNNKGFHCDICKRLGSNHWLYRCGSCEFDAHMNCAMGNTQSQPTSGILQNQKHQLVKSQSVPPQFPQYLTDFSSQANLHFSPPPQQVRIPWIKTPYSVPGIGFSNGSQPFDQVNRYSSVPTLVVPQYVQPPRTNRMGNDLMGNVVEGIVGGLAQQAGQAVLQGIFGGF